MSENVYKYYGRMNDPHGSAYVKGICGDEMEFCFLIKDDVIVDVKFYTEGCEHTKICGEKTAEFVVGKDINEVLKLSPALIMAEPGELPEDHIHCTILTTITFLKALADYLFKRDL